MIAQRGFLLSYLKYGDSDAVLHVYTRENGVQSFFSRGIFSSKSKKKAYLSPFNELDFFLSPKSKGAMKSISKFELHKTWNTEQDFKANMVLFFVADFLQQILRNEEASTQIYEEIEEFLMALSQKNYQAHLPFMMNLIPIQGFTPMMSDFRFLDPESGKFAEKIHHPLFDEETSKLWKTLLTSEQPYQIKIKSCQRKTLLDSLLVYYHYHITDFRTPKSLEILQQIFE